MVVLGIDTSTKTGSVALFHKEEGVLAEINANIRINHSDSLMGLIDTVLKLGKKEIKDIDRIVVSKGPGSFTGIRVGVGTGKGLAYSLGSELVGINELDVIANTVTEGEYTVVPLIDARKERVYHGIYKFENSELKLKGEYGVGELRELLEKLKGEKVVFTGDGSLTYRSVIEEVMGKDGIFNLKSNSVVRAGILCELGSKGEGDNLFELEPFYISKTQAERERDERLKKK